MPEGVCLQEARTNTRASMSVKRRVKGYFMVIRTLIRDCKYSKFAENGEVFSFVFCQTGEVLKEEKRSINGRAKTKNSPRCCSFIKIFRTFAVTIIIDKKNYNEETIAFITTDFRNLGC